MASQVNVRNCIRAASQKRLDLAWAMKDNTLEELTEAMGALKDTARYYQRMVEAGTTVSRPLHDTSWEEARQLLDSGVTNAELAISWGWTPQAMRNWVNTRRAKDSQESQQADLIECSKLALRLPFARWGELVNNTTRGV